MIASPTLTSAAATTIIKNTKTCASLTTDGFICATADAACIFENATINKLTAFSINSMHINMMIELRRVSTPTIPVQNKATAKPMYHLISIIPAFPNPSKGGGYRSFIFEIIKNIFIHCLFQFKAFVSSLLFTAPWGGWGTFFFPYHHRSYHRT